MSSGAGRVAHRHLDYDDSVPLLERGLAALDDILERGDLEDWRPIAAAIRADPRGPLADAVLGLCRAHPMYGTSVLWEVWIEGLRRGPAAVAGLGELRRRRGLRQVDVAERLGVDQSEVSRLEARRDVRVSTLRGFVAATGGQLRMTVEYAEESVDLHAGGILPG